MDLGNKRSPHLTATPPSMGSSSKKNYRQDQQETPQQNQDGHSCSRTTNHVRPTPPYTKTIGTHTLPILKSVIDRWILHQETAAPSCHCELAKVEQAPSETRLRQNSPSRGNVPEAAQLACYWLSTWTWSSVGLVPKGKTTEWFFQSPRRGLAVLTHGNQKDPCLSKSYMVGFAIIY